MSVRSAIWRKALAGLGVSGAAAALLGACSAATPVAEPEAGKEALGTSAPVLTAVPRGATTASAVATTMVTATVTTATPMSTAAPSAIASSAPVVTTPGKGCKSDGDCATGQSCGFTQGCDTPGVCGPPKMCTKDLVPYCGCDGTEFRGSSTCPARAFRHRGKC